MSKIGIFYGSCGGITGEVAEEIGKFFDVDEDDIINMEEDFDDVDQLLGYDILFLGSSTWGQGDVQRDWVDPLYEIEQDEVDFSGKTVALFGAGDCESHAEHFVSALGKMHDLFKERGAKVVGSFPTDGYTYEASLAIKDGMFCGLPIDNVNEEDKTEARVQAWCEKVKSDLG